MAKRSVSKIPSSIGPFQRYQKQPTTMVCGVYYDALMEVPFDSRKRHVRVWLPESYSFENPKPHPVLYMADGQNLVDRYLTKYGDWHLDQVVHVLHEEGLPEPILVGIDSPKDGQKRSNELNPPYPVRWWIRRGRGSPNHPIANVFIDFIVETLKPLVDELFATDTRLEATGIGGSSMGGIMAFYAFLAYPEHFGYAHAFSPPLFFYTRKDLIRILEENNLDHNRQNRLFLYVGGKGFERKFTKDTVWMYNLLKERGFDDDQVALSVDPEAIHHEDPWSDHSLEAFRFWLSKI